MWIVQEGLKDHKQEEPEDRRKEERSVHHAYLAIDFVKLALWHLSEMEKVLGVLMLREGGCEERQKDCKKEGDIHFNSTFFVVQINK